MLNEKVKMVYDYIKERMEDGIPPTVREICTALDIKSTSTVHRYINLLVENGLLEKMDNQNRAIRLAGQTSKQIPLVGTVTAGTPITAVEEIEDYISWAPDRRYSNPLFALKVRGTSMINTGIFDGDIVIVEQKSTAENGDIVVALIDKSDATVKRFYREDGHFRLQPENDSMEPIILDEVDILGKVVAVLRYL